MTNTGPFSPFTHTWCFMVYFLLKLHFIVSDHTVVWLSKHFRTIMCVVGSKENYPMDKLSNRIKDKDI
jgi:hypothetical protein